MTLKPTPKQEVMLRSTADFILYGGARAGGKTFAAILWFLYRIHNPHHRGLVIRRNAKDLSDFVDRAFQVYKDLGAKKTGNPAKFTFPSGAIIYTGHLGTDDAYTAYQGHEYDAILIEELTHIPTKILFEKMMGSLRSPHKELKPQFLGTTNPGGVGAEWVKEYWHIGDASKPMGVKFMEEGLTKCFIQATVYDNPHLLEADPKYVKYLESLPDTLRKQWLEGDWSDMDVEGAYYSKQMNTAELADRVGKVPIEPALKTFTFWDLGISDATSIWVMQAYKNEIRAIAYYENNNEGLTHYINWLHDFRDTHGINFTGHYFPHDIEVREMSTGKKRSTFLRSKGISPILVPNKGIMDGIEAARNIIPQVYFDADRCSLGIKALKNYRKEFDDKRNIYKDQPLHDWASHGADAFRYFAVAWTKTRASGEGIKSWGY